MSRASKRPASRPQRDPFGESAAVGLRRRLNVLGGDFAVESNDAALLQLAVDAFGGLPSYERGGRPPRFRIRLVLTGHRRTWPRGADPQQPAFSSGGGFLCATLDAGNFTVMDIENSRALVCVSSSLLSHRHYARSELIELTFLTLASRVQHLVPLHAACVGRNGAAFLLIGSGGTGKSTLSLHAMAEGMEVLSEDNAFVATESMLITGVPNYLHIRPDSLDFLPPGRLRERIERSPMIERGNGTRKLEVDLRGLRRGIARAPMRLAGTLILSRRSGGRQSALRSLDRESFITRLRREQPYAAAQANWRMFEKRVVALPAYELRRTAHPGSAVRLMRSLLDA